MGKPGWEPPSLLEKGRQRPRRRPVRELLSGQPGRYEHLLSFSPVAGRDSEVLMRDQESGSLWNGLTGEALEGPRKGVRLAQVPATTAFWLGWKDYHPATEMYAGR